MASIRKSKSRTKPILTEGHSYAGTSILWAPPENGMVKAIGIDYTLRIGDHVVHISEDEMLAALQTWLQQLSDIRREERKRANVKS